MESYGRTEWRQDGILHREDGPAASYRDGTQEWYQHGHLHRDDGPAVSSPAGFERWYKNGVLHRTNGPALTSLSNYQEWWIDGVQKAALHLILSPHGGIEIDLDDQRNWCRMDATDFAHYGAAINE